MADKPKPKQSKPLYHVCRVDPDDPRRLEIIAPDIQAATQVKAMDSVAEGMDGKFALAAFLASSLRAKTYENELKPSLTGAEIELEIHAVKSDPK